jgi:CubicO group peptidase (beta-lactamase class C family)
VLLKKIIIALLILIFGYAVYFISEALPIGTGFTARFICTHVFKQERDPKFIFEREVKPEHPLFSVASYEVDYDQKTVTARGLGFFKKAVALYRPGLGCTLAVGKSLKQLKEQSRGVLPRPQIEDNLTYLDFPSKASLTFDQDKLDALIDKWMIEPGKDTMRNSRAILVAQNGAILSERYHEHFDKQTPILGWSMTKSVTNALIGVLVGKGDLDIRQQSVFPEWNDERKKISIDDMLRMSSGLKFEEVYGPLKDATYMLYDSVSMADYARDKHLETSPGSKWYYSSGTTNMLARLVFDNAGSSLEKTDKFVREELFDLVNMNTAFIEVDPSGVFVGSSYMYASARDWARFGQLYLQNGNFGGKQVLPAGWVSYSTSVTKHTPKGEYGAHIWLNAGNPQNSKNRKWPNLPADLFYFGGHNKQIVAVIPSLDLVIVRLGVTFDNSFDRGDFIKDVLSAFPAQSK